MKNFLKAILCEETRFNPVLMLIFVILLIFKREFEK